ncbi:MAG: cysteine hydrolase [Myxococcota bacterium]
MPELATLIDPQHTALITQECQQGVVGVGSALPDLAAGVARVDMLGHIAQLMRAARTAGVRIVHCVAERRPDGFGANRNARLFGYMAKAERPLHPGSEAAALVPEIGAQPDDVISTRLHGLSPFQGTELDSWLRNEGITTIVGVGVSVNVAIQNFCFDAVNASYQMVVPTDAVAGFPAEYVDQVFAHTLGAIATLTDTRAVEAAWAASAR